MPAHEDDHVRDHDDGQRADDGLQTFLLPLRQVRGDHLEGDADADADHDRGGGADPDLAQGVPAALLAQEGGDDPDDERRLQAFAQPDHERRQHPPASQRRELAR